MSINRFVNKTLDLGIIITSSSKGLYSLLSIGPIAMPNLIDNVLEICQFIGHGRRRAIQLVRSSGHLFEGFYYNLTRHIARLHNLCKRSLLLDHGVEIYVMLLRYFLKFFTKSLKRYASSFYFFSKFSPVRIESAFKKSVSSIRRRVNHLTEIVRETGKEFLSLFEVAKNYLPGFSPTRTSSLRQSIHELSKGLNLSSSIGSSLSKLHNIFGLLFGVSLLYKFSFGISTRNLSQSLSKNFSSKPLTFS